MTEAFVASQKHCDWMATTCYGGLVKLVGLREATDVGLCQDGHVSFASIKQRKPLLALWHIGWAASWEIVSA